VNYYIEKILKEKTITSYLEEQGIFPAKKSGDKDMYCCPVHKGDNDPSFIVYPVGTKGREYQTFYCFGCHAGINLINLKSAVESISPRASVRHFLKDVEIDLVDAKESIIRDHKNNSLGIEEDKDVERTMLLINTTCRKHIAERCYFDEDEILFFEDFFKKVDKVANNRDLKSLEQIYDILVEGSEKRVNRYRMRKEEMAISTAKWTL